MELSDDKPDQNTVEVPVAETHAAAYSPSDWRRVSDFIAEGNPNAWEIEDSGDLSGE
jgi:hypothetical protein